LSKAKNGSPVGLGKPLVEVKEDGERIEPAVLFTLNHVLSKAKNGSPISA
jgi:hypothetical protein